MRFVLCLLLCILAGNANPQRQDTSAVISNVHVSSGSFAPSAGESVTINYHLEHDASITIKLYDPDKQLVRTLAAGVQKRAGAHSETWDGRDVDGQIVPNEAYFFTIEAITKGQAAAIYDPLTFSGGEYGDISQGQMSKEEGTISYKLARSSRVLLRAGIQGGAMLKTLVDWQPRTAGAITERWDGMDSDHALKVWDRPRFTMILLYMTLPENSIITVGNSRYTYAAYKAAVSSPRANKESAAFIGKRKISPHFLRSRLNDRDFHVRLTFPDKSQALAMPVVKDHVLVRVDVLPEDRAILLNQQYEVMLYTDLQFHAEEERGYLPFNFLWDVGQLSPGEHVLTVNISSHTDQVGVGSRKIAVVH